MATNLPKSSTTSTSFILQSDRLRSVLSAVAPAKLAPAQPTVTTTLHQQPQPRSTSTLLTQLTTVPVCNVSSAPTSTASTVTPTTVRQSRRKDIMQKLLSDNSSDALALIADHIELPSNDPSSIRVVEAAAAHVPRIGRPPSGNSRGRPSRALYRQEKPPILLPLRPYHPATDFSEPLLDFSTKYEPIAICNADHKYGPIPDPMDLVDSLSTGPSSGKGGGGRLNLSSGDKEILKEIKRYRRFSGYTLFALTNKKKYLNYTRTAAGGDGEGQVDEVVVETGKAMGQKWRSLWSSLSVKTQHEWKAKASRLVKLRAQLDAKQNASDKKRQNEASRINDRLDRCRLVEESFGLLDAAANLQLLSDSFAALAKQASSSQGPVDVASVESLLLDGLLASMLPLVGIASQIDSLASTNDIEKSVCNGLNNLTYCLPI